MSAVPRTTDIGIVLNNIPSDIGRVIVGYERHDLGVTLQGEYANIFRRTQHTFSSLVPGARYTVVVQLQVIGASKSQEEFSKLKKKVRVILHLLEHISSFTRWCIKYNLN